jgi:hypothetical protein
VYAGTVTFKIKTHFMSERPNPDKAPYRPAIVSVTQYAKMKPIQLKISATEMRENNFNSVQYT